MSKHIMVINDTAEILSLFELILTSEGYAVSLHSYSNFEVTKVEKFKPDLIISDHPVTNQEAGWQFLEKMKLTRITAKIPIIVCTTSLRVIQEAHGRFAEKGVLVVAKPFDIEELLQAVVQMIGNAADESSPTTDLNPKNKGVSRASPE